jgi:hypothetical protein
MLAVIGIGVQSRMLATKDVAKFAELGAREEVAYLLVFDGGRLGLKVRGKRP